MKLRTLLAALVTFASIGFGSTASHAATCDQYPGDAWIYSGVTSNIKPNILIIIDTSGSMSDLVPGGSYDPAVIYADSLKCGQGQGNNSKAPCEASKVYTSVGNSDNLKSTGKSVSSVTTSCGSVNPRDLLNTKGVFTGKLKDNKNTLDCSSSGASDVYQTGNYINYINTKGTLKPKIEIARDVVKDLISTTSGINIGVMVYNNGSGLLAQSQGSRFFNYAASGTNIYTSTVKDMDAIFSGTMTNRTALVASINAGTVVAKGFTPLAESLYEAGRYFRGEPSAFGNILGLSGSPLKYTSPIEVSCQENFIIFVTDGMSISDDDPVLKTVCPPSNLNCNGDFDGDKVEPGDMSHSLDDVAKYLYDIDLLPDDTVAGKEHTIGKQILSTYIIGFGEVGADAEAVKLLQRTADSNHGHGAAYLADNQSALSAALTKILGFVLSADSSFVAPVVPVSPENRTYGSNRVYMGFFKPQSKKYWHGNLKKYGLDTNNNIVDKNNAFANWVDADNDGYDDNTKEKLPGTASSGAFRSSSVSYWSSAPDASDVDKGGAGELLLLRTTARNLYTNTGTAALTPFNKTNITPVMLDLDAADNTTRDKLVDFIHGIDTYDDNADGKITDKRKWLFGDVLHSRPLAVNYATYQLTNANEANCNLNKTMIYVGSNDGMLHAIRDCNGSEAWGFIPSDMLANLKEIPEQLHTYFVDAAPAVYIYDKNKDGNIDKNVDKVIMMIGMRRGGGSNTTTAKGSYYLLDITDPESPKFSWSFSKDTAGFSELGEGWGEPKIVKLKIGGIAKIAAIIGGGYDNLNEDSRYGATQTFDGTGTVNNSASGSGNLTSAGASPQSSPKGRGIYAVEIASLSSTDVPTISTAPTRLWGVVSGASTSYTTAPATDKGLNFSIVSDIAALDTDGNGFTDRLYAADLGGNLWRFDVGAQSTASWIGYKIFSANPGSSGAADKGRKIFYKPAVTLEASITDLTRGNDALIFIGTGDREHPLNTAVVDRIYAVRDKGQKTTKTENDLLDVTTDQLQTTTIANTSSNPNSPTPNSVDDYLKQLSTNYGWYIKLDQSPGEKILASPTVFNKVAYLTSYTPGFNSSTSATSLPLGIGPKTLTVTTGLAIIANQRVFIENNSGNIMKGRVTSYSPSTGSLVANITSYTGSGTYSSWQVTWGDPCAPANLGNSRVYALNYDTGEAALNYDKTNDKVSTTNKRAQAKPGADVLLRSDRVKTLGTSIPSGVVLVISPDGKIEALVGSGDGILQVGVKKGGSILNLYWGQKK